MDRIKLDMAIVRFPNEDIGIEIKNFDYSQFQKDKEYSDETFGWYKGTYVAVLN